MVVLYFNSKCKISYFISLNTILFPLTAFLFLPAINIHSLFFIYLQK